MYRILSFLLAVITLACQQQKKNQDVLADLAFVQTKTKKDHQLREIKKAEITPNIDGKMDDPAWKEEQWYSIGQNWIGTYPESKDYLGRYKTTWTPEALYVLVEIRDDVLYDQYKDPFKLWWDDDCVEIFIDADNSGGEHQYNNNAFAYHIALDGNVIDLDANKKPILYNNHITTKRITNNNVTVWEHEVILYDDTYEEGKANDALVLRTGQKIGFAIAYNDNDGSTERENMMGSVFVPGEDKNQGWINADIFGTLLLVE